MEVREGKIRGELIVLQWATGLMQELFRETGKTLKELWEL